MQILTVVEIIIGVMMLTFAILALNAKKLIHSVIFLSLISMLAVVVFVFLKAPDVAITEAVIGSGLVTAVFVFTLFSMKKDGEGA